MKFSYQKRKKKEKKKEALVSDYMDISSPHTLWNLSFTQAAHDWEIEYLGSFLTLLYSMNPERMIWTPSSCHGFAVKSYYTMLQSGEHILSFGKAFGR
jgi:hypothetical protein